MRLARTMLLPLLAAFFAVMALFVALLSSVAFGQAKVPANVSASGSPYVPQNQLGGAGPVTLYVDPAAGKDSNACAGLGAAACQTIQAAVNVAHGLAGQISGAITIQLAAGTYDAGAYIEDWHPVYNGSDGGNPTYANAAPTLTITGTPALYTTAGGPNSGTLTSATAGGTPLGGAPSTYGTATLTAAGWTVNDLTGQFLKITGGTGAGQQRVIDSNTATVITIVGSWVPVPDATSTFQIVQYATGGTIINSSLYREQGTTGNNYGSELQNATLNGGPYGFIIRDTGGVSAVPKVMIQNVAFVTGAGGAVMAEGPSTYYELRQSQVITSGSSCSNVSQLSHWLGAGAWIESVAYQPNATGCGYSNFITALGPDAATTYASVSPSTTSQQGYFDIRWNKFFPGVNNAGNFFSGNGYVRSLQNHQSFGRGGYVMYQGGTLWSFGDTFNGATNFFSGISTAGGFSNSGAADFVRVLIDGDVFDSTNDTGTGGTAIQCGAGSPYGSGPVSVQISAYDTTSITLNSGASAFGYIAYQVRGNCFLSGTLPQPTNTNSAKDFFWDAEIGTNIYVTWATFVSWGKQMISLATNARAISATASGAPSKIQGGALVIDQVDAGYVVTNTPQTLFCTGLVSMAAATKLGGYALSGANSSGTARAFTVTAGSGAVTVASGGGAANTVATLTDGTNTCTVTIPCNSAPPAGTNATGAIRVSAVNGAGTGCVYPTSAAITASITTGGCTTTQPTIGLCFEGKYQ